MICQKISQPQHTTGHVHFVRQIPSCMSNATGGPGAEVDQFKNTVNFSNKVHCKGRSLEAYISASPDDKETSFCVRDRAQKTKFQRNASLANAEFGCLKPNQMWSHVSFCVLKFMQA